jgi:glycosyltransferase involved in cell wall biosynthesis
MVELDSTSASSRQSFQGASCLRIALLVESSSAGVGRHVIDLTCALLESGHSVHLLYSSRRIDGRFSKGLAQLALLRARTCAVDMRHGLHPADAIAIWRVRSYLRANGPFDILHCHSTKAGLVGRLAAVGMGCCILYTPHGLVTNAPFRSRGYRALAGWLERGLAVLGDVILCNSEGEKRHAEEVGLPSTKLCVIPNGIDTSEAGLYVEDRAAMRARLSLDEADICVGFVGRMIPGKGPGVLLEAFALAQRTVTCSAKLVFVGSGPECFELQSKIEVLGLRKHVIMAGELNGLQAMSAFDIFVLPSLSESFSYVLLEALAIGLPVISTDVGAVDQLVHEGCNGLVVKISAPEELADALRKLLSDSKLRSRMGGASKELSRQFSLAEMARRVVQVYRELLS